MLSLPLSAFHIDTFVFKICWLWNLFVVSIMKPVNAVSVGHSRQQLSSEIRKKQPPKGAAVPRRKAISGGDKMQIFTGIMDTTSEDAIRSVFFY